MILAKHGERIWTFRTKNRSFTPGFRAWDVAGNTVQLLYADAMNKYGLTERDCDDLGMIPSHVLVRTYLQGCRWILRLR